MSARTDIHRPSAPEFDPEVYSYEAVFDLYTDEADVNRAAALIRRDLHRAGWTHGGVWGSGKCDHCGTSLRYAALLTHRPTRTYIYVGEQCLDNRFSVSQAEFQRLRKSAQLDRERQAKKAAFLAFVEDNPVFAYATYAQNIQAGLGSEDDIAAAGLSWGLGVLTDIVSKTRNYGGASTKQVALVNRILGELEGKWAAHILRQIERAEAGPAPTGRQAVQGTVRKTEARDQTDYYGRLVTRYVFTVELDNGARVWGTIPAAIADVERGARVEFTATFEASDTDGTFAFYSRPAKARML
jgi:hypothetical protein